MRRRPTCQASGEPMKVYTRSGDDGTTGLSFGGRVSKNSPHRCHGTVDETQAALGLARGETSDQELDDVIASVLVIRLGNLRLSPSPLWRPNQLPRQACSGGTRI